MSMSIKDYETITGKSVSQDIQCKGISDAYQSVIKNFKLKKNVLRFCVRDSLQDKFGQSLFGKKFKPHCQMAFSSIWEVILSIERDPIADVQSIRSVQSLSRVQLFVTPWNVAHQASLSITNSRSLLKLKSIESVMPSNHLILCCSLLLLPLIFPSIRVFSNESVLWIRWPKYWGFSFSISPSNEYSGLISVRIDWLGLLDVQGTFTNVLQHHSSKASILQRSAFFIVQLSHPYMTTGKTVALTGWTFVGKVMSLLLICNLVWS